MLEKNRKKLRTWSRYTVLSTVPARLDGRPVPKRIGASSSSAIPTRAAPTTVHAPLESESTSCHEAAPGDSLIVGGKRPHCKGRGTLRRPPRPQPRADQHR